MQSSTVGLRKYRWMFERLVVLQTPKDKDIRDNEALQAG